MCMAAHNLHLMYAQSIEIWTIMLIATALNNMLILSRGLRIRVSSISTDGIAICALRQFRLRQDWRDDLVGVTQIASWQKLALRKCHGCAMHPCVSHTS